MIIPSYLSVYNSAWYKDVTWIGKVEGTSSRHRDSLARFATPSSEILHKSNVGYFTLFVYIAIRSHNVHTVVQLFEALKFRIRAASPPSVEFRLLKQVR